MCGLHEVKKRTELVRKAYINHSHFNKQLLSHFNVASILPARRINPVRTDVRASVSGLHWQMALSTENCDVDNV